MIVTRGCGHAALLWHCRLWRGRRPGITGCSSTGFGSDQKSCNFFYPPPPPRAPCEPWPIIYKERDRYVYTYMYRQGQLKLDRRIGVRGGLT